MANHPSALKRARQSQKRKARNKAVKTRIKTSIKAVEQSIEGKDQQGASSLLKEAVSIIHKAAGKGVIHKNKASRKISKLTLELNRALKAQV